jgi:D-serine deaminase-like pyridoxal phosphate-dependent protein
MFGKGKVMMKAILAAILCCAGGSAFAGVEAYAPISYEPIASPEGSNDASPALILLALVGAVIATGTMGGFATRDKTTMLPGEPDDM